MGQATVNHAGQLATLAPQAGGSFNWAQILAFVEALIALLFPTPPAPPATTAPGGSADPECCAEQALYNHLQALRHSAMAMTGIVRP